MVPGRVVVACQANVVKVQVQSPGEVRSQCETGFPFRLGT